jgi:thiamine-monophosphate kinase
LELRPVPKRITSETELIETYLAPLAAGAPGAFDLKDDAALIEMEAGFDLVVSTDPVIAGVHFFADDEPQNIAWKALAVNVSDLAAKGAEPIAYTMALAFPEAPRRDWMAAFSAGLREAQTAFGCTLIGGDTDRTSGPLSIGVTAFGKVPRGLMVRRGSALIGDRVFVTGTIGDSALGLQLRKSPEAFGASLSQSDSEFLVSRYLRPQPRVMLVPRSTSPMVF